MLHSAVVCHWGRRDAIWCAFAHVASEYIISDGTHVECMHIITLMLISLTLCALCLSALPPEPRFFYVHVFLYALHILTL